MGSDNDLDPLETGEEVELDVDDPIFDEDDAYYEDEEFGDEEFGSDEAWDDYGDEPIDSDGEPDSEQKKKKFNVAVIGGGIFAVLVVLYMMGSGGEAPQPSQPQATQVANVQQPESTKPTNLDIIYGERQKTEEIAPNLSTQGKKGLLYDDQALAEIQKVKEQFIFEEYSYGLDEDDEEMAVEVVDNPPMPSTMSTPEALTPLPDTDRVTFGEANFSDLQSKENAAKISAQNTEIAPEPASSTPRPPTQMADLAGNADLSAITKSLEQISERLTAIEKASVTKKEFSSMQEKISSLEEELTDITRRLGTEEVASKQGRTPERNPASAPSIKAPSPPVTQEQASVPVAPRKPKAPEAENEWVLKGAQPGSALVSLKDSEEVIALRVGDSLPGIGNVQVIAQENGRWIVTGSQGRILQQ